MHGRGDVNTRSKIRCCPLVRAVADGGSKNEMMPVFFVQSGASRALSGPLHDKTAALSQPRTRSFWPHPVVVGIRLVERGDIIILV